MSVNMNATGQGSLIIDMNFFSQRKHEQMNKALNKQSEIDNVEV